MADRDLAIRLLIQARDEASGVLKNLSSSLKTIGGTIAAYFTGRAIGGFFGSATSGAAELQAELSRLQSKTGATADEIARLKAKAEELGASDTLNVTATQSAQAMTELGAAGQNTAQILASVESTVALAQGATLELGESAGIVTANLAGFNLEADQAGRVADVLTKGANSAKTTVRALADALSYAAPSATAAGMSIEKTVAIIAKMQNAGIDGTRAGTALNSMLTDLKNPASAASKALDAAGLSTRDFAEVLAELEKGGSAAENVIIGFGKEAGPALRALLTQGSAGVNALEGELNDASGAAKETASTMGKNLKGALDALGSVWDALTQKIGDPLLAPVEKEVRSLAKVISEFSESAAFDRIRAAIVSAFKAAAASAREFAAAVDWEALGRKIEGAAGRIESSLGSLAERTMALGTAIGLVVNIFATGFATIEAAFSGILGVFSKAAQGLVYASTIVTRSIATMAASVGWESMQRAAEEATQVLRESMDDLDQWAKNAFGNAAESVNRAADSGRKVQAAWMALREPAKQAADAAGTVGASMRGAAKESDTVAAALERVEEAQYRYESAMQAAMDGNADASGSLAQLTQDLAAAKEAFERVAAAEDEAATASASTAAAVSKSSSAYVTYGSWVERVGEQARQEMASRQALATAVGDQAERVRELAIAYERAKASNASIGDGQGVAGAEELAKQLETAKTKYQELQQQLNQASPTITPQIDTKEIDGVIKEVDALHGVTTYSDHRVEDNVPDVLADLQRLDGNDTSSTHTVYVREVQQRAGGGIVIDLSKLAQRLSGGGFTRPNWDTVPGVGDQDTVPAALPEGAYVLRKQATVYYGARLLSMIRHLATGGQVPVMLTPGERWFKPAEVSRGGRALFDALNNLSISRDDLSALLNSAAEPVHRFAAGGSVGSSSSAPGVGSGSRDTVDINLSIGARKIQVQGARDQAMALASALNELKRGL